MKKRNRKNGTKDGQPTRRRRRNGQQNRMSYELTGIFTVLFSVFLMISLFGYDTGVFGEWITGGIRFLFGVGALVATMVLFFLGGRYALTGRGYPFRRRIWLLVALFFVVLAGYHQVMTEEGKEMAVQAVMEYGGIFSAVLTWGLRRALGFIGTSVLLIGFFVTDILLITHWSISEGAKKVGEKTEKKLEPLRTVIREKKAEWQAATSAERTDKPTDFLFRKTGNSLTESTSEEVESLVEETVEPVPPVIPVVEHWETQEMDDDMSVEPMTDEFMDDIETDAVPDENPTAGLAVEDNGLPEGQGYQFPPLELLHEGKKRVGNSVEEGQEKARLLEATLASFGVKAHVIHVTVGPSVTRFELEPAPGVRVSKIENLSDDIALQLAATQIRIEAPIPGKSAVGIEVPNGKNAEVGLRDVLDSDAFQKGDGNVLVALGKDIAGNPVVTDLADMPHVLIAGATGSGKSVCINTLITSILYHSKPEDVKLILVDPKVVELSVYNGIPHLRTEVVTQPKKAAGALHWAINEMEERYKKFSESRTRDIGGYNASHPDTKMPYIVVIIDELADLMMVAKDSVEQAISRLAQKARAAGIHLVLATQRPSVDVITGLIKANIPSRISFAVSSQIDSRTILDKAGAEKLLGKGDMLFVPRGTPNPIRVQGAFISDGEVEAVTEFIRNKMVAEEHWEEEPPVDFSLPGEGDVASGDVEQDELFEEAVEWVVKTKRASTSSLQRHFRVGFTRAGRMMDSMEAMGVVGPAEGTKPREVFLTKEQLPLLFKEKEG